MLRVSGEKLMNFFGAEPSDLALLLEAGMPGPDESGKFEFFSALRWFLLRQRKIASAADVSSPNEKTETLRVQIDLRIQEQTALEQLLLDKEIGSLSDFDAVFTGETQRLSILREKIWALPQRFAHRLAGLPEKEIRRQFMKIVNEIFSTRVRS